MGRKYSDDTLKVGACQVLNLQVKHDSAEKTKRRVTRSSKNIVFFFLDPLPCTSGRGTEPHF